MIGSRALVACSACGLVLKVEVVTWPEIDGELCDDLSDFSIKRCLSCGRLVDCKPLTKERAMQFGDQAKDKVTGYEGVVIGRTSWITGCDTYALQPQGVDNDGKLREVKWFDVARLEVTLPLIVNIPKPVVAADSG